MRRPALFKAMQPVVFLGSAGVIIGFILFGTLFTQQAAETFRAVQSGIIASFGWFYVLAATGFLVFVLWLLFSPYGGIRLGGEEAEPEFSYFAWFTMLFAAGMGIGLVFWGVAEPLTHYAHPPTAEGRTPAALNESLRFSFYHWGLHPWGVYILFALALSYFHFRHGLPLAPRSLLYPLIGERIHGLAGHLVDILATVGTLFGVATSLGLGAMQINSGLAELWGLSVGTRTQVIIIALITLVATISVVSGLKNGIRRLSQLNMILAGILLLFVLAAGPTVYILETFISGIGAYLQDLPRLGLWMDLREDESWQADWTLFYWSWWISWSPFVGVFVARISKGRTVREFILSVLLVPTLMTFLWLSVFGGTALYLERFADAGLADLAASDPALALHAMLRELPWSGISSVLATLLVIIFFITSSDSGSFVDDMVTSGGHPNPPRSQRVFWALAEGATAVTLLVAGGLQALRTASLTSGLPMTLFLIAAAVGIQKALRRDAATDGIPGRGKIRR